MKHDTQASQRNNIEYRPAQLSSKIPRNAIVIGSRNSSQTTHLVWEIFATMAQASIIDYITGTLDSEQQAKSWHEKMS